MSTGVSPRTTVHTIRTAISIGYRTASRGAASVSILAYPSIRADDGTGANFLLLFRYGHFQDFLDCYAGLIAVIVSWSPACITLTTTGFAITATNGIWIRTAAIVAIFSLTASVSIFALPIIGTHNVLHLFYGSISRNCLQFRDPAQLQCRVGVTARGCIALIIRSTLSAFRTAHVIRAADRIGRGTASRGAASIALRTALVVCAADRIQPRTTVCTAAGVTIWASFTIRTYDTLDIQNQHISINRLQPISI